MLRVRLLAGAWSPAALLFAVRISGNHFFWSIGLMIAGLFAFIGVLLLVSARGATNPQPYKISAVKDESAQVPGYLLTFVFPFVFVDASSWRDALAWFLFAALAAALVASTDLVLVNPVLLLAGYKIYAVESTSGYNGIMLSAVRPRRHQVVEAVQLPSGALKLTSVTN